MHLADPDTQPEFYASVAPKRAIAWVIDTVAIILLCVLIVPFTAFIGLIFFATLYFVIGFLYRLITITGGSATLGMRLMAIEFRDASGRRFDLSTAFWHTTGYTVWWMFAPLQFVSAILMLVSSRGQGLSDHILGTTVLNCRAR